MRKPTVDRKVDLRRGQHVDYLFRPLVRELDVISHFNKFGPFLYVLRVKGPGQKAQENASNVIVGQPDQRFWIIPRKPCQQRFKLGNRPIQLNQ